MAQKLSAAEEAAEWSRSRAARKQARVAGAGAGAVADGGSADRAASNSGVPPHVQIPEGVAMIGQDMEASEVLFRQLGQGYVEQLEALQRDGALGSDSMRTMHETAETEVKMQCARAGARISDILHVVTNYMSRVHGLVTGVAERQRALFASAVETIVNDGCASLALFPLPLSLSYKSEKSLCGAGRCTCICCSPR